MLLFSGCLNPPTTASSSGELGDDAAPQALLELSEWQPLGTIITPDARLGVATVLADLWIPKPPENAEIITRNPNGVYSAKLGEPILQRRRVITYSLQSGNPSAGDLVFFRKIEEDALPESEER